MSDNDASRRVVMRVIVSGFFKCGYDLLFGQARAIVAIDQQSDPAAVVDVPRPTHRLIKNAEFLEKVAILLEGRDRLRTSRSGVTRYVILDLLLETTSSKGVYRHQLRLP